MAKDKRIPGTTEGSSLPPVFSCEEFLAAETTGLNKDVVAVVMSAEESLTLEELTARVDGFLYRKEVV